MAINWKPLEVLANVCKRYGVINSLDYGRSVRDYIKRGEEIPDELLPGRVIMSLPEEQREALRKLTSEELQKQRYV